ncbi:MAG: nicotinamide-nucleotide adenylyltransferase [Euryarchaeota archaeon]|nr:nicotinamide-nucleotide adenylyltransferase [Euryarchaeota archaeon]
MNALYIGRFQPFHYGHLQVIKYVAKTYDEIIIGIGSSQYHGSSENPFSAEERKTMIEQSLGAEGIKNFRVVLISDIHNPPKWVDHVLTIVSDFDVVLSNNDFTKELFSEKGYLVKETPFFKRTHYSGVEIRRRMNQDEDWGSLVPKSVVKIIDGIHGVQRVKKAKKN